MEKFFTLFWVFLPVLTSIFLPQPALADSFSAHPAERSSQSRTDTQSSRFADRFTVQPAAPVSGYTSSAPTVLAAASPVEEYRPAHNLHRLNLALELSKPLSPQQLASLHDNGPWLNSETLSINAQQLIRSIQNAAIHGLNPDSYGLQEILLTVNSLSSPDQPDTQAAAQPQEEAALPTDNLSQRNQLSGQMDKAFIKLARHLGQGVVDARATQKSLFRDPPLIHAEQLLESVHSGRNTALQALSSVTPQHSAYQRLTAHMRNLLTERASGSQRAIVTNSSDASSQLSHVDIYAIKSRLGDTGDLALTDVVTPYFDQELTSALQQFQVRHGLNATGRLDLRTRNVLNLTIEEEIQAIALSLERWRWMPRKLGKKHLFINIPDYRVVFRNGEETQMSMRAVVGSVDHPTPSFSRDMSYMEFNPTWTVPQSIANRELIPRERRNPGYLVSRQFDFLKFAGNQLVKVPPEQITTADLNTYPFPYLLRQRGGPINALGRLKFMMPNPYAIYLHDTQAKKHFTLNDRAYSHGCIRLSDPDALATLLMREDGYSQRHINASLKSNKTKRVRLRTPIPTHLTYMTSWIDDNGELQRRADVYRQDDALIQALQKAGTLLTTLMGSDNSIATLPSLTSSNS